MCSKDAGPSGTAERTHPSLHNPSLPPNHVTLSIIARTGGKRAPFHGDVERGGPGEGGLGAGGREQAGGGVAAESADRLAHVHAREARWAAHVELESPASGTAHLHPPSLSAALLVHNALCC